MATTLVDRRHFKGTIAGLQAYESSRSRVGTIEEQVADEFRQCGDDTSHLLNTCECSRMNPVASTATDDSSASLGQKKRLLKTILGQKRGISTNRMCPNRPVD